MSLNRSSMIGRHGHSTQGNQSSTFRGVGRAANPLTSTTPYARVTSVLDSSIWSRHALLKFWITAREPRLSEPFYDGHIHSNPYGSVYGSVLCRLLANSWLRDAITLHPITAISRRLATTFGVPPTTLARLGLAGE